MEMLRVNSRADNPEYLHGRKIPHAKHDIMEINLLKFQVIWMKTTEEDSYTTSSLKDQFLNSFSELDEKYNIDIKDFHCGKFECIHMKTGMRTQHKKLQIDGWSTLPVT